MGLCSISPNKLSHHDVTKWASERLSRGVFLSKNLYPKSTSRSINKCVSPFYCHIVSSSSIFVSLPPHSARCAPSQLPPSRWSGVPSPGGSSLPLDIFLLRPPCPQPSKAPRSGAEFPPQPPFSLSHMPSPNGNGEGTLPYFLGLSQTTITSRITASPPRGRWKSPPTTPRRTSRRG
jgi:hypothetical protein